MQPIDAKEDSPLLVAVKTDASQNLASAIDEDEPLQGNDKEEIEMQEVIVGDQGNIFIYTISYLLIIDNGILLQTSIEAKLNLYSPKRSHLVRNTNVGNRSQTKLASKYLENTMHRDCCHFNFGSIYYCTCVPK